MRFSTGKEVRYSKYGFNLCKCIYRDAAMDCSDFICNYAISLHPTVVDIPKGTGIVGMGCFLGW